MVKALAPFLAIKKGIQSRASAATSELYKMIQKPTLFNGFNKTFEKADEEGEDYSPEKVKVQKSSAEILEELKAVQSEWFDITATVDWGNTQAKADLVVDGQVLLEGVPVTYLLFLEKRLTDIKTFISKMPVLDTSETWTSDPNSGLYRSDKTKTRKTMRVQEPVTLHEGNEHHAPQVQLVSKDVLVGHWNTVKLSGALPAPEKKKLLKRVTNLLDAVKSCREEANATPTQQQKVGDVLFNYLLG